jgi:NAD-dependent oxidoreductase involved in siderophore biosynthesis
MPFDFVKAVSPPEQELARRLHRGLRKRGLPIRKLDLERWSLSFQELLKREDPKRVKKVMDWFLLNFPDGGRNRFTPVVWSAKTFVEKFDRIDAARWRQMRLRPPTPSDF